MFNFQIEDGSYSRDKYYTALSKSDQEQITVTARLDNWMHAAMCELVREDKRYGNLSNFIRDAIYHCLRMRKDQAGANEVPKHLEMLQETILIKEELQTYINSIQEAKEVIGMLLEHGAIEQCESVIENLRDGMNKMKSPWDQKLALVLDDGLRLCEIAHNSRKT